MSTRGTKTILDELNELPEPYRSLAIAEAVEDASNQAKVRDAAHALSCAFNWSESPQGIHFWTIVHGYMVRGQELPDIAVVEAHAEARKDAYTRNEHVERPSDMTEALRSFGRLKLEPVKTLVLRKGLLDRVLRALEAAVAEEGHAALPGPAVSLAGTPIYEKEDQLADCWVIADPKLVHAYIMGRVMEDALAGVATEINLEKQ